MPKPLPIEDLAHILAHTHEVWHPLRDQRVFLTGGTGFFGHWLLESLLYANRELELNVRATVLTRNPEAFARKSPHVADDPAISLEQGDIRTFRFPTAQHSFILHAATDSSPNPDPATLADSIIAGTQRVLDFARATGARRLLYVSSGAVYGRNAPIDHIPEDYPSSVDPASPTASYDESKRMAEQLCIAHADGAHLQASIARCFAFVGPHLPLDLHFAIGNFLKNAIDGTPIHIKGDGAPRRSWLYMADLAIWLWTMLVRAPHGRAYNVGSEDSYSIAEAARLTAATLRPGLGIQIDGTPKPGAPLSSYVPATVRARTELNLHQTIDLPEALRRTAAWHGYRPSRIGQS